MRSVYRAVRSLKFLICYVFTDRLAQRQRNLFLPQHHNKESSYFLDAAYTSGFISLGLNVTVYFEVLLTVHLSIFISSN